MREAARWQAALEVLEAIEGGTRPPDGVLARDLKGRRYAGAKDRRAITELVYSVLRARARLDWWCEQAGAAETSPRHRLLALARLNGLEADDLHGGAHALAVPDGAETAWLNQIPTTPLTDAALPDPVRLEVPASLLADFRQAFGDAWEAGLKALNEPAPVHIRANAERVTAGNLADLLAGVGVETRPLDLVPDGLCVTGRTRLENLSAFRDGLFEVQDQGSQLIAELTDARPGLKVLDACAGAGGKTLALAARMAGRGTLIALDTDASRLQRMAPRLARARPAIAVERLVIGPDGRLPDRCREAGFDRILCDLPCSGTGTWRRDPTTRWRLESVEVERLARLQDRILDTMAPLVAPGGRLVIATCSVLNAEGPDRLARFLGDHADFALVTDRSAPSNPLRLAPHSHDSDGFYVAVCERR